MRRLFISFVIFYVSLNEVFAGIAIPDTRRDQTWTSTSVAASSFRERRSASVYYRGTDYDSKNDRQYTYQDLYGVYINRWNKWTYEGYIANEKKRYSARHNNLLYSGISYLLNPNLSVGGGLYIEDKYSDDDNQSYRLSVVQKLNNDTYIGGFINHTTFANSTYLNRDTYSIAFGKRTEKHDYEIYFNFRPEDDSEDSWHSRYYQLGAFGVYRVNDTELHWGVSQQNWDYSGSDNFYSRETNQTNLYIRPEFQIEGNFFFAGELIFKLSDYEHEEGYKEEGSNTYFGLYGRYITSNQFQIYMSYGLGDVDYNGKGGLSDTKVDSKTIYLKLSYLF